MRENKNKEDFNKSGYDRDVGYWNMFYAGKPEIEEPSNFAQSVLSAMEPGRNLIELGCGNGRDSIYFYKNGLHVTAIDASDQAIDSLQREYGRKQDIRFICDDFVCSAALQKEGYDYCYSRFTLHAITWEQEAAMLQNVYQTLRTGGKFFIEVRSVNDEIYGKGENVGKNCYIYNGHFRRFIVMDELVNSLEKKDFVILYAEENTGFAPFGDSDPPVIRVIAYKGN